ncbi:hypothetical protein O181_123425 [Austropuccinia psidii MF-1]|uniref:Uncharacterized protein n=1 Tax=Austropuccinia psidii MF-1 TaxID=1389203 RepID=A0A9Q3KL40_9BASI|nr:hypothetical protein [Austropuccinia psidii MF-1]
MVYTRNGSSYSVQPDGPGQGRGKTRTRSAKSSSRKTHLEDTRAATHSPRSVPKNFDVNSEPELIESNVLRAERLSSGSHSNISVQILNWFREAKEEEWQICPSLWQEAMNPYLHIKSFLGQEKTIEVLGGWRLLSFKDKVKKIKNLLKNQSILSVDQKKELEMTPALEEGLVLSTSSKTAPEASKEKPRGPQKKKKGPKKHQGKGKGKANLHRPYQQGYRIPKLEPSAVDNVFHMARTLMEFTVKEKERINRTFPCK